VQRSSWRRTKVVVARAWSGSDDDGSFRPRTAARWSNRNAWSFAIARELAIECYVIRTAAVEHPRRRPHVGRELDEV
jgi:hypothetical protein